MNTAGLHLHPALPDEDRDPDALLSQAAASSSPVEAERLEEHAAAALLPLARNIAGRYRNRGVESEVLTAVANFAVAKAIRSFEPRRGGIAAYASTTIHGEIKKHFRDHAWSVRPPRRLQELHADVNRAVAECEQSREDHSAQALAARIGADVRDVRESLQAGGDFAARSLDAPSGDGRHELQERVASIESGFESVENRVLLADAFAILTREEKAILHLRFVEERTQQEIADVVGVSQMQVSRRLSRVLAKLRAHLEPQAA